MSQTYSDDPNAGPIRVEVIADDSGTWAGNGLRWDRGEALLAEGYAKDLFSRWMLVRRWRVVDEAGTILKEGP